MKRTIFALGAGAAVFALVLGAAATMPLDGGAIQQGTDLTLTCQETTVSVDSWGLSLDPSNQGKVTFVQLTGIESDCLYNRLMGAVYNAGGTTIGYTTLLNPGTGGAFPYAGACVLDETTTDIYDCYRGGGVYKLQLIDTGGGHGVNADQIEQLRLWIEGPASS